MILSATSDDRLDALCTQGIAGRFAFASVICEEDLRITVRHAPLAKAARKVGDYWQYRYMVAGTRRRGVDDKRDAVTVNDGDVFCKQFTAVKRDRPSGVAAAEYAGDEAIPDGPLGFRNAGLQEECEKVRVEIVPDSRFVPSSKPGALIWMSV